MRVPLRSRLILFCNSDARAKFSAGIMIAGVLIFGLSFTACHKKAPVIVQESHSVAPPVPVNNPSQSTEEQSCRAFVQNFYDWYWNRFAEKSRSIGFDLHTLPNVETVLKLKPSVLSPELSQLLEGDEKEMQATHKNGDLDFDPFWGNQDAQGKYIVGRASVAGDLCKARIEQGDEFVEVQKSGTSWVFVNFYYCFAAYDSTVGRKCPDSDLLQILKH